MLLRFIARFAGADARGSALLVTVASSEAFVAGAAAGAAKTSEMLRALQVGLIIYMYTVRGSMRSSYTYASV